MLSVKGLFTDYNFYTLLFLSTITIADDRNAVDCKD